MFSVSRISSVDPDVVEIVQQGLEKGKNLYEGEKIEWTLSKKQRLTTGGMATLRECTAAIQAAKDFSVQGRQCISTHTVFTNESPFTPHEYVTSIRAVQAVRMANEDPTLKPGLDVFLELTERMRQQIIQKFNRSELVFHLSEFVCRRRRHWSSLEQCSSEMCLPACMDGCPESLHQELSDLSLEQCTEFCQQDCESKCMETCSEKTWLSHPIHADANADDCDMLDDGVCVRRLPIDITSHLYLNEDFEGGDFFFMKENGEEQEKIIQPSCGRMIAYSSGGENLHGVNGVREGERCLVTVWLTPDHRKIEELPLPSDSPYTKGRRVGPGRDLHPASKPRQ